MAWRSSGTNNESMVDNLKGFGVIHSDSVEAAFRGVDRRLFVPRGYEDMAHLDQPLKEGNVHISAPHIYGTVLEALELTPDSGLSFLNLGVGTGYLSCIVAHILGHTSRQVGVDIHADVVDHCRASIDQWRVNCPRKMPIMDIIQGNALNIDLDGGEAAIGFDRMYIGASVDGRKLKKLVKLLRLGGIFVGPVDDNLVKVVRIGDIDEEDSDQEEDTPRRVPRSFRGHPPALSASYSMQIISAVRFSPLIDRPLIRTTIPVQIWDPSIHRHYPDSFRQSCREIMLCSSANEFQPPPQPIPFSPTNVAAKLPKALWMEILSYTDRYWFQSPPVVDERLLRRRLIEEQAASRRAHEARLQAETRLELVERERDVYRLLALRWQSRLQGILRERGAASSEENNAVAGMEDFAEIASEAFANEPLILRLGSLSSLMRRLQESSDQEDASENDEMEEDDDDEDNVYIQEDEESESEEEEMSVTRSEESPVNHGHRSIQPRTVSISGENEV